MNVGKNTVEHWTEKHKNEYMDPEYDFSQIDKSPLSYHKIAADIIKENYDDIKNTSILEIGCATGYFLSYLARFILPKYWNILGWDFSPSGIKYAQEKNKEIDNIRFKEVNILNRQVEGNYGFICCFETIEHIDEGINYRLLDQWLEHCEYLILSTVDTIDDCRGEHISHYTINTFDEKNYNVIWKEKLSKIDMSALSDYNDYHYIIFMLKGKLSN